MSIMAVFGIATLAVFAVLVILLIVALFLDPQSRRADRHREFAATQPRQASGREG